MIGGVRVGWGDDLTWIDRMKRIWMRLGAVLGGWHGVWVRASWGGGLGGVWGCVVILL